MPTYTKLVERTHVHDATYVTDDPALPGVQVYANVKMPQSWTRALHQVVTRNPNYQLLIAKKSDASTDYSRTYGYWRPARYRAEVVRLRISEQHPSWKARGGGFMTSPYSPEAHIVDVDDYALMDKALTRIKRKLASESGFFNAAVPVGELRELRRTVTGTLPGIKKLLLDSAVLIASAKRKKGEKDLRFAKRLEKVKQDLGDVWLNFNFGIRPTLSDIEKILESVRKYLGAPPTVRVRGSASKEWFSGEFRTRTNFLYGAEVQSQWNLHHTLRYTYVGGFSLKCTWGADYNLDDQLGLNLGGLPSVGWELHPFSWVLDYFANVGQWLDDQFVAPPGSLIYLNLSRKYEMSGKEHGHPYPTLSTDALLGVSSKPGSALFGSFSRTKLTKLPHIGFRLKSYDEVGKNAINKLANLASLLKLDATQVTKERFENERRLKAAQRSTRRGVRSVLLGVKTKTKK